MKTKLTNYQVIRGALREVNSIRALIGLKPLKDLPKGKIGDSMTCPQAKALTGEHCSVDVDTATVFIERSWPQHTVKLGKGVVAKVTAGSEEVVLRTPKYMRQFVYRFDTGKLPQYKA